MFKICGFLDTSSLVKRGCSTFPINLQNNSFKVFQKKEKEKSRWFWSNFKKVIPFRRIEYFAKDRIFSRVTFAILIKFVLNYISNTGEIKLATEAKIKFEILCESIETGSLRNIGSIDVHISRFT